MPKASDHTSESFTKLLVMGKSGAGKTSALLPLLGAGYKVSVLDMDNNLKPLIELVKHRAPEALDRLDYMSFRNTRTATGKLRTGNAWPKAMEALTKWDDGTVPSEWGAKRILVIDTLTRLGDAAYDYAEYMDPAVKDKRQWFYSAQRFLENCIAGLTSEETRTNVIINTHINYGTEDGLPRGLPSAIGSALGPKIPAYFSSFVLIDKVGEGREPRRIIRTASTTMFDLKNPKPFEIDVELPQETGLLTLFQQLQEHPNGL